MRFLWLKGNILEGSIHKILKNWFMLGSLTVWMDAEVWRAREKRKSCKACLILPYIFCLKNKIHFSIANANDSASLKKEMVQKSRFLLIHKQQTNLWMKLATIPPGLAGKIVKYRPLSEPIRLQDLKDSAPLQA